MSAIVDALLADLDDDALAVLANRLRPHLQHGPSPAAEWLNVQQAAEQAGVSPRTVRRALAAGLLEGQQAAGRWRVASDDLEHWRTAGAPTTSAPNVPPTRRTPAASQRPADGTRAILGRPTPRAAQILTRPT